MNKKKLLALVILISGFTINSYSQATATATATATVVTPITISKTADMNFGNIAVQAATGGTVTLTRASGSETMSLGSFTSNPSATGALSSGTQNISVGATLTVAAGQVPGVYTSGNLSVTVNYN